MNGAQETGTVAKQGSKDDNERFVSHLLCEGYLQLDFSCTAYATNCYLKLGSKSALLLSGNWQPCDNQGSVLVCSMTAHQMQWIPACYASRGHADCSMLHTLIEGGLPHMYAGKAAATKGLYRRDTAP